MAKFIPIDEVILSACMGDNDILQRKKMKYLFWAKKIWNSDLNLTSVKEAKREIIGIDKRTRTLELPCDAVSVSGVYIIGAFGEFYPVYRNDRLHNDIVDIAANKNCNCTCKNELCNMIKGYEAVVETIESENPDGSIGSFTCTTRKAFNEDGQYQEIKQYPKRIYTDGVWTSTEVATEVINLCALEVDAAGCVVDCEENYQKVVQYGCYGQCPTVFSTDQVVGTSCIVEQGICKSLYGWETGVNFAGCGGYLNNSYNITEEGNRLIFPYNFGFDQVLVRYYADIQLQDMKIPAIAEEAFIVGLKYWETLIDEDKQGLNRVYSEKYSKLKWALLQELNKQNSSEMKMSLTPPIYIPGFNPSYNQTPYYRY